MRDFDAPERFRHKVLDSEITVDDKAKGWELAGSWKRINIVWCLQALNYLPKLIILSLRGPPSIRRLLV